MSEKDSRAATELLNASDVARTIARIAHQIIEKNAIGADTSNVMPVSYTHLTLPTKA